MIDNRAIPGSNPDPVKSVSVKDWNRGNQKSWKLRTYNAMRPSLDPH